MGQGSAHRRRSRLPDLLQGLRRTHAGDDGHRQTTGARLRYRALQYRLAGYRGKPAPASLPALYFRRYYGATDAHCWLQAAAYDDGTSCRALVDSTHVTLLQCKKCAKIDGNHMKTDREEYDIQGALTRTLTTTANS